MTAEPKFNKKSTCPAETTLKAISGRWKILILRELFFGVKRFGELQRSLVGITQKMLTEQLRELEADGIIHREVYPQIPPKVEYSLTQLGESLKPTLEMMHDWGIDYENKSDSEEILP
jgi:DNA-binding HxlR family transcriptional regulator